MPGVTLPAEQVEALDHEVKFVFPGAVLAAARAILLGACRREEPHAASLVETIYFDGPGLESLAEKLGSDYRKSKIRLRWYDRSPAVWLEVKRRVGGRREKLRLPVAAVPVDGRELSRRSLDSPALAQIPALLARRRGDRTGRSAAGGAPDLSPRALHRGGLGPEDFARQRDHRPARCRLGGGGPRDPAPAGEPALTSPGRAQGGESRSAAGARGAARHWAGAASRFPSTVSVSSTDSIAAIASIASHAAHGEGIEWERCSAS